jgi:tetratricopeptide (TPR) repeat protein/serine/threonine protein kinase
MAVAKLAEDEIFNVARKIDSPDARADYLNQVCSHDNPLRGRIEALLQVHEQEKSFLQPPTVAATGAEAPAETPGAVIGPYKLLQEIGEGGMGVVWMAEQTQPVQRKVALKVIKPGMDSRQVVARFEAERQALAMMDHVSIARVFDGGTTENGRPYFVMELVHGVPITKYCDGNHLTPRERLELFVPVCQAIQHAHQKGIIHRDIKPSNVMVTLYDGKPVPKVIDFGVAKATEQKLTERTLFTQYGTMVGTLEYMSPEQAEMSALGVDTRSDIYSLGVLLYELLTGSTPLTRQRMKHAAYAEILRLIKEEEPPRPSTRLSDSGEALASISAMRKTEPAKLTKLVRGELDWIVMKCLEKDRNRRYDTANGFAADVQRYLADEPVQACPPSVGYRLRKFARRHKSGMAVAAMILFFFVLLGSGAGWALRDRAARDDERARERTERLTKVAGQVESILGEVERLQTEQKWSDALAVARRAQVLLASGEADADTNDRVRQVLANLEMVERLEEIRLSLGELKEDPSSFDNSAAARHYAAAFRDYGVDLETLSADQAAARLRSRQAVAVPLAAALDDWGLRSRDNRDEKLARDLWRLAATIDPDPRRVRVRQAVAARDVPGLLALVEAPDTARQPPQSQVLLALSLGTGNQPQAIALLERASEAHPADFWIHFELGYRNFMIQPRRLEAAVRHYIAARALRPASAVTWNSLAVVLVDQRKLDEAIACYQKAVEIDPKYAKAHNNLGNALADQKKLNEAIASYQKAIEIDPKLAGAHSNLGLALANQKKLDEAIACYQKAIEIAPKLAPAHYNLGNALADQKKLDVAIACYQKAIEIDPNYAKAHYNLGAVFYEEKKLDESIACFKRAIELAPKDARAHERLGSALHKQKKLDEAIACFRTAIKLDPNFAQAHSNLGNALADQKKLDEAIACHKRAIEVDSKYAYAHYNLGNALYGQNKLGEAIACWRKAIEVDPKLSQAYGNVGAALVVQGKEDEAIAWLRKAIVLDPKEPIRHCNLAWLCATSRNLKLRDPAQALRSAKIAVGLEPQGAFGWQVLGWAYYRTGTWKESILALDKSIELQMDGGDSGQFFFLAMAQWRLGEQVQARKWYDRAVTWMDKNDPQSEQLRRFRAEAANLLEVKKDK